jgi:hypothetical protein
VRRLLERRRLLDRRLLVDGRRLEDGRAPATGSPLKVSGAGGSAGARRIVEARGLDARPAGGALEACALALLGRAVVGLLLSTAELAHREVAPVNCGVPGTDEEASDLPVGLSHAVRAADVPPEGGARIVGLRRTLLRGRLGVRRLGGLAVVGLDAHGAARIAGDLQARRRPGGDAVVAVPALHAHVGQGTRVRRSREPSSRDRRARLRDEASADDGLRAATPGAAPCTVARTVTRRLAASAARTRRSTSATARP